MAEFRMPSLGADMETGTVIEWKVKPGDRIKRGDIIAVVETEKAAIEIEVFEDGIIEEILVQPGIKVPVGTVLAIIRSERVPAALEGQREEVAEAVRARVTVAAQPVPPLEEPHPMDLHRLAEPSAGAGAKRVKASPYARRLAAKLSVDLTKLRGTGLEGAIQAADVERFAASLKIGAEVRVPPAVAKVAVEPPEVKPVVDFRAGMRRAIAAAMSRSNREIPHYYLQTRIDMSGAMRWLEAENQKRSIKQRLLPAVLMLKAVALALGEVPELNGYWIDDRHQPQEAVNIGFAIALRQGGLITPALLQVDLKGPDELMEDLRDLITRTRAGRLRSSEVTGATITVTNLGDLGVETVFGVIYPPQVALVGFGKIMEQPWADNGMLGVRPVLTATLAADHRATDGRRGAQFLDAVNRYLQEPTKL
jgi:pyruvate dehydrogenase E2 component (dihydrolipoamide acetyltransferase)